MKRPKLNMLRTFEVAGRRLSFSLAAAELNITQAAVSQQIRNLEAYLGSNLFIRNHRQLSLNGVGQAYLGVVQEALDRLDSVTDQLFPDRPDQTVTIRCTSSIATLWLAPQISAFHADHPNIDLRIQTLDSELTLGTASKAELEIFISEKDATDSHTQQLLTSSITPVAAPGLLENNPPPENPVDILSYKLIHVTGYTEDWHRWLRKHGMHDIPVPHGFIVDGSLVALGAAMRGEGIMLGRRPFIDQYLASGQLTEVFEKPHALSSNYYLRQAPVKTGLQATSQVTSWLLDIANKSGKES